MAETDCFYHRLDENTGLSQKISYEINISEYP